MIDLAIVMQLMFFFVSYVFETLERKTSAYQA